MQRHSVEVKVEKCIIIPSSKLPLAFPLPSESCEVEVLDETDYPYPIVFFFGDIHLYTNGTHQTEEKHRFKSESLNDDDKLDSQAYEMHPQLNPTPYNSDIDVEITTVNATSSVSSQVPPTVNDHKNTPFAQLNDVPDMRRDGSNKSNDGSSRVWQCALLGLPWEVNVEDLCSFLEPYADSICRVVVVDVPASTRNCQFSSASTSHDKMSGTCKTCVIDFISKGVMLSFYSLYNDLHIPSFTSLPPCVTLQISDLSIEFEMKLSLHHHNGTVDNFCTTPEVPASIEIPTCTVCIRRLLRVVSGVHTGSVNSDGLSTISLSNESLLVGPDFVDNGDRCKVCLLYGKFQDGSTSSKSICQVCGISENIWVCLQCGYAGCGRYTAQHAKNHYNCYGHPFSLELVTGRIWSYVGDRFVHVDPMSEYLHCTASSRGLFLPTNRSQRDSRSPWQGTNEEETVVAKTVYNCVGESDVQNEVAATTMLMERLDLHTADKLGNLQQDYDAVLEMQLNDQELYYEKLIARETVRLLEAGYTERCSGGTESLLQESFGDDVMTDDDLASIEKLKVEISIIEYEYVELLKDLCQQESITASIRQDNNHLLKIQKGLRTTIADRQARTREIREKEMEQIAALKQDIRDMEFFLRTSQEMTQVSPQVQSDVREGRVLLGEGKVTENNSRKSKIKGKKKK